MTRPTEPSEPESDGRTSSERASAANEALRRLGRPVPAPFAWAESFLSVGVTGTNGKTSTTHLLGSILRAAGEHVVWESTLGYFLDGEQLPVERGLRGFYGAMERAATLGHRHAVIEVTSKALLDGYAEKWRFDHAIFTNLTRDHIAEHGSWEHYLASKAQLFVRLGPGRCAALNACDEAALLLDRIIPADVKRIWYGAASRGSALHDAALFAERIEPSRAGTHLTLAPSALADALGAELAVGLIGEVYGENALACSALALALGMAPAAVRAGLAACSKLPGRFEIIRENPLVVLDYAHSPDALARVCDTGRRLSGAGRLIVVFGAAGGYDSPKREAMGEAVGARADLAFVTNENPRHEDPAAIIAALARGCERARRAKLCVIEDRTTAIRTALDEAHSSDLVLVTGRGRDRGMWFPDGMVPYSDADVVAGYVT